MSYKVIIVVALAVLSAYYWQTRIKQGPVYESKKSLIGKTVIITGGNAGIGKYTAIEVAKRNARLIIASRNVDKSEAVKEEIIKISGNNNIRVMKLDLENFDSVRQFAEEIISTEEYVDYLVNNAGAWFLDGLTKEGYSRVFTINHLGHFLLTNLLLDKMKAQSSDRPVRIINLSSEAYKFGKLDFENLHYDPEGYFDNIAVYATSKLANVYFTSELANRLQSYDVTTYSVHPGVIYTEFENNIPNSMLKTFLSNLIRPMKRDTFYGAQPTMYLILDDDVIKHNGKYFNDNCQLEELLSHATDEKMGKELWERSAKMVGLVE